MPTSEEVCAGLPEPDGLVVEFSGAAVGPGDDALPQGLHARLAVGVEEDDDGVPLGVVQRVHRLGRHVQQRVFVLEETRKESMGTFKKTSPF